MEQDKFDLAIELIKQIDTDKHSHDEFTEIVEDIYTDIKGEPKKDFSEQALFYLWLRHCPQEWTSYSEKKYENQITGERFRELNISWRVSEKDTIEPFTSNEVLQ